MLGRFLAAAAVAALLLATSAARADDLTLATVELGSWNDALAALRADLGSQGRTFHVTVQARGAPVACETYRLELDEAAAEAFRVGVCDPRTGDTAVSLVNRAALFDQSVHVPRPRTITLAAALRATAVAGGAPQGGSAVRCSMAVQPYLDDLQHGTRVLLTPEHYVLRPGSASITVTPNPSGWSFSTTERAVVHLEYEVLERSTGELVLRQQTTLTCGPEGPPAVQASPAPPGHVEGGVVARPESMERWIVETKKRLAHTSSPRPRMRAWGTNHRSSVAGAIFTSILTTGALTTSVTCFAEGARPQAGGGWNICGGIAIVPTVIWGAMFAGFVYDASVPAKTAGVRPSLAVAGRSAQVGLGGAF